jgi:hypothetical protein
MNTVEQNIKIYRDELEEMYIETDSENQGYCLHFPSKKRSILAINFNISENTACKVLASVLSSHDCIEVYYGLWFINTSDTIEKLGEFISESIRDDSEFDHFFIQKLSVDNFLNCNKIFRVSNWIHNRV